MALLSTFIRFFLLPLSAVFGGKYEGFALFQVIPPSQDHLKSLQVFINSWRLMPVKVVDVWREPTNVNKSVEILVSPDFQEEFRGSLKGMNIVLAEENIQRRIDAEAAEMDEARANETSKATTDARMIWGRVFRDFVPTSPSFNFKRYHTLDEIHDYMDFLKDKYKTIVQITTIGRGHNGGKLQVMQVASNVGDLNKKPAIWIDGGIHAREWVSPATVLYFITQLVEGYDRDAKMREYVDNILWYFLPVMNPDGYVHSHTSDRFWRKNRRELPSWKQSSRFCDQGVDLNRNFDWHHCGKGASTSPCSEIYCGDAAFSEPETRAVSGYIKRLKERRNLQAYLTLHSFSQIWMYPYGHEKGTYAPNVRELRDLSLKAVEALRSVHGTVYQTGTAADTLYEAAGGSDDWAHGSAGVRYTFLVELRPCEDCAAGFMLPAREIEATGEETWAAVKVVADKVLQDSRSGQKATVTNNRSTARTNNNRIRIIRRREDD